MKSWLHKFLFAIHYSPFTKKAFTLAEVLITLGIIGVIAGMTIPSLMQNVQDRQLKEAAKAAFSKASQAVQLMKVDTTGDTSSFSNACTFSNAIQKYFKIMKVCPASNSYHCVNTGNGITTYKSLFGNSAIYWQDCQFITQDGMFWGFWSDGSGAINFSVDVNSYTNGPNIFGRDVFFFYLGSNYNLIPSGAKNTTYTAPSFCDKTQEMWSGRQGMGCMEYVMEGKDY